ncbi:MAG: heme lyase CcmF/NrfE family subunit [Rhodospirillaceae bacterium]|nr:heme lyase CcmF/NrfE family subunit [Rhodospirillaceae bacterium]
MIAEIGHFALILALVLAVVQGTLPLIGAWRGNDALMAVSRPTVAGQFVFISLAFACLMYAYVVSDFSIANVVANSHSAKPLLYKFTAVWGNHEGSMLLWVWILALYGAAIAAFGGNLPPGLRARVLAIQGLIGVGFLVFLLATSNPFLRLDPAPLNGRDLNPLLQDPGLAFHPPLLYFGYVGLSVAFSFAVAALIEGKVDPAWARWVRPWSLLSWSALTAGIVLGSWWAYYELGWGGFWFWDPVENASFMPWLMATALLHSAIVAEKRDALKSWTVLLAILGFSLSLMGTFLVRSGMLTSVHSFAADPARGVYILGFLVLVIGGSLSLYAWRAPAMRAGGRFRPISREGALVVNNLLLVTGCAAVFIGTLYPLILDAISGDKVSVGPPFFESSFVWIMAPLFLLAAAGPLMAWKRADIAGVAQRLTLAFVAAAVAAILLVAIRGGPWGAILGLTIAAWLIGGVAAEFFERVRLFRVPLMDSLRRARVLPRSAWGMSLAHAGIAILIAGAVGATNWQTEHVEVMQVGESAHVAGYDFTLVSLENGQGPNYDRRVGEFRIEQDGELFATLYPEKRKYWVQGSDTTEAAIRTTWLADIYVAIGDPAPGGGLAVRIYHNPLVPWIWLGTLIMVLGGLVSLSDRRHRVGAPNRARQKSGPAQPPQSADSQGSI